MKNRSRSGVAEIIAVWAGAILIGLAFWVGVGLMILSVLRHYGIVPC